MVIDADVHISPYPQDGGISPETVIQAMDRSGVDKAVIWLQPPYLRQLEEATQYVREAAKRYPDRLIPFGWVDPHLGIDYALDLMARCLEEYGFYGIKLNGAQNSFSLDSLEIAPILEKLNEYGKPLALHIGDESDNTHPRKAASIAARYPGMPLLMVHMGGAANNMEEACIEFAGVYPNMYLVGSSVDYRFVLKTIRVLGAERVLFGSDMPFSDMHADTAGYQAFLTAYCTAEERRLVMGENLVRLLQLKEVAQA